MRNVVLSFSSVYKRRKAKLNFHMSNEIYDEIKWGRISVVKEIHLPKKRL